VQNATENGDWGKLYELVKSGGQSAQAEQASDSSANS
jgi:hypothetical protein